MTRQDDPAGPWLSATVDTGRRSTDDVTRVRRQVTAMTVRRGGEFERQIKEALRRRRATAGSPQLVDLNPAATSPGLGPMSYAGELLVRVSEPERGRVLHLLRGFGGFETREIPCRPLDERLLRLAREDLSGEGLQDAARLLRQAGYAASANYVTPLGPVAKGLGGPENADEGRPRRTSRPPKGAVRVAVIDTGITAEDRADGWLASVPRRGNIDPLDALPRPDGFLDFAAGHGTAVAGIVEQVAPDCQVLVRGPVSSDGVGSALDVASAMVDAVFEDGALVLNLSLGTETVDDEPPVAFEAALEAIRERAPEVLVVAAAGNAGTSRPVFPAAMRQVVAVAALTATGGRAEWSSRGHWVDCSVVGEGVLTTYVQGTESPLLDPRPDTFGANAWALVSGTSFAAPQVAGRVAQLCQVSGQRSPRAWLARLLGSPGARDLPDYGKALTILTGT